jgi:hypothetical protein
MPMAASLDGFHSQYGQLDGQGFAVDDRTDSVVATGRQQNRRANPADIGSNAAGTPRRYERSLRGAAVSEPH